MNILISHEIPKQLFPHHRFINDYPYLLGHLLSKKYNYDEDYANFYKQEIGKYEFSILDNSGYELGEAIDSEVLYELGEEYKPTHIILPDVAFNRKETLQRTFDYIAKYGKKSTPKFIACIQGQGLKDFHEVYNLYEREKSIDLVGVSMCIIPREEKDLFKRVEYIEDLVFEKGFLEKKLHLLGCKHPNEFKYYKRGEKQFIHSIDTSAPIIYGWNGHRFGSTHLPINIAKPREKLADNLNIQLFDEDIAIIANNIKMMRSYINWQ